jgi:hypothetical protein
MRAVTAARTLAVLHPQPRSLVEKLNSVAAGHAPPYLQPGSFSMLGDPSLERGVPLSPITSASNEVGRHE